MRGRGSVSLQFPIVVSQVVDKECSNSIKYTESNINDFLQNEYDFFY